MAALGTVFGIISAAAGVVGTIVQMQAQKQAGKAAQAQAEFQAKQLEEKGKEEVAAAQREAMDADREKRFVQSKLQANASSSGLGALDDTVMQLAEDIEGQGYMNAGMTRYGGRQRQLGLKTQAAAERMSGAAAKQGAKYAAMGTLLSGIGSFAGRYGGSTASSGGGYSPYYK